VFRGGDFTEAGIGKSAAELSFVGEAKDMGSVGIGPGDFDVLEKRPEHGGEERIFVRRSPSDEGDSAAGLEYAAHFAERFLGVRDEHEAEAAGDAIKVPIREGELLGVGGVKFNIAETAGSGKFFGDMEHLADEVGCEDASVWTDGACDRERRLAGAAGEIEHVVPGGKLRAVDDEFGGATRLVGELGVPFFPERGGGGPFLADGFAGVGSGHSGNSVQAE